MSILTKEGIQKILNDDWLLMDDCEGLENCTVIKELARMALDAMDSEPVAYMTYKGYLPHAGDPKLAEYSEPTPLYADPRPAAMPAAPVVPDRSIFEKWWESQNGAPLDGWDSLRTTDGYCDDGIDGQFEAWSAAMLQAGDTVRDLSTPVDPQVAEYEQNVLQAGNYSVIPEWIPVSERMPETDGNYWGWWSESKRQGPVWFIKSELQAQFQSSEITHWMPLPAAPQEVPDGQR